MSYDHRQVSEWFYVLQRGQGQLYTPALVWGALSQGLLTCHKVCSHPCVKLLLKDEQQFLFFPGHWCHHS